MKIGILTQPLINNYGGLLQNYALQTVLKKAGHDVVTLDWSYPYIKTTRFYIVVLVKFVLHYLSFGRIKKVKGEYKPTKKEDSIIHKNVYQFVEKYISKTKKIYDFDLYCRSVISKNYDAFIVGSDQCWRPCYNGKFLPAMYLSFLNDKKIKRIAYAASFGTDEWEYDIDMTEQCSKWAQLFDLITVREASGVTLCKNNLNVEATQCLDPTLLLDRSDYIKIMEQENEQESPGNLFYYILDPSDSKQSFVDNVAKQLNLKPFVVLPKYKAEFRTRDHVKNHLEDCVYPSVTSWLRAFFDAKIVITDSFHGTVFSIIFNKPFWVFANNERGKSRFTSLLALFGLENRIVDPKDFNNIDLLSPIDWESINIIKNNKKEESIALLLKNL